MSAQTSDPTTRNDALNYVISDAERHYRKTLKLSFIISATLGFACLMGLLLVANESSAPWWFKMICDLLAIILFFIIYVHGALLGTDIIIRTTDPKIIQQAGKTAAIRRDQQKKEEETYSFQSKSPDQKLCDSTDGLAQITLDRLTEKTSKHKKHSHSKHNDSQKQGAEMINITRNLPNTQTYQNLEVLRRDLGMAVGHEIPDNTQSITQTAIKITGHAPIIRIDAQGNQVIVQQWGMNHE